jgi:hypothetical protein
VLTLASPADASGSQDACRRRRSRIEWQQISIHNQQIRLYRQSWSCWVRFCAVLRQTLLTEEQALSAQVHTATTHDLEHRGLLDKRRLELGATLERKKSIGFAEQALLDAQKILAAATTQSHEYTAKVCALQQQMTELMKEQHAQHPLLKAQQLKVEELMQHKECALVFDDGLSGTQKMDQIRTQTDPLMCLAGTGESPNADENVVKKIKSQQSIKLAL